MTPFETYFATNIEPALKGAGAPPAAVKMAKASAADIWNAALDAICRTKFTREEFPPPVGLPHEICEQIRALKSH